MNIITDYIREQVIAIPEFQELAIQYGFDTSHYAIAFERSAAALDSMKTWKRPLNRLWISIGASQYRKIARYYRDLSKK